MYNSLAHNMFSDITIIIELVSQSDNIMLYNRSYYPSIINVYYEFGGGGGNRTPVRKVSSKGIYMFILCFKSRSSHLPETGFNPSQFLKISFNSSGTHESDQSAEMTPLSTPRTKMGRAVTSLSLS